MATRMKMKNVLLSLLAILPLLIGVDALAVKQI